MLGPALLGLLSLLNQVFVDVLLVRVAGGDAVESHGAETAGIRTGVGVGVDVLLKSKLREHNLITVLNLENFAPFYFCHLTSERSKSGSIIIGKSQIGDARDAFFILSDLRYMSGANITQK